ncbi:SMP-30/gluconolactonase/LRE family protein [Catalinimonas sp. 4WD22]|uniref:SMP-30/gluconolactonase/LRE family protein n=1 Tax=Catalinimonas locisalis TaxID=3133978 RepID=UPI0031010506
MQKYTNLLFGFMLFAACNSSTQEQSATQEKEEEAQAEATSYQTTGSIERISEKLNEVVPPDAQLEILAEGYEWTEGPVWIPQGNYLLYSDIPPNSIFKWKEGEGASLYLKPSGFTGENFEGREPGSNGLILDDQGRLVLCQHGDRRIARMTAPLDEPAPQFETIVDSYQGKRLNSPNDLAYLSNGDLYFTDPPYGLPGGADSEAKELDFQGVYRYSEDNNELVLLTDELSRPNGIGFSPNGETLYVANSDPERAIWMAYDVNEEGNIENGRVFYDATDKTGDEPGLPDGFAVHSGGYLFATGPGGVWVFSPEGEHLGTLKTGQATANCTFNADESVLYITADMYLMRIVLKGEAS